MFFKSVIIDLDNTIYDYDICHSKSLDICIRYISNNSNISIDELYEEYEKSSIALKKQLETTASSHSKFLKFKLLFNRLSIKLDILELNKMYWDSFFDIMNLNDGVIDVLNFFKENLIKCYILTNYTCEYQYEKIKKLNISEYFEDIFTSEEIGNEKPNIKSFLYCIDKIKEPKEKIIMIGDNINDDINSSIDIGIFSFLYNKNGKFDIHQNMCQFGNFKDLLTFFKEMKIEISNLSKMSKYCGERFDLTQSAGGNISVKYRDMILIKSSGIQLSNLTIHDGYSIMNNKNLKNDTMNDIYMNLDSYNIFNKNRGSMETYMHSFLKKYSLHLHPIQINSILINKDCDKIIKKLFPNSCFIPYKTPGIDLSKEMMNIYNNEEIIFMASHGIVITSDSYNDLINILETTLITFESILDTNFDRYKYVNRISSTINSHVHDYVCIISEDSHLIKILIEDNKSMSSYFPDMTIFCGEKLLDIKVDIENEIDSFIENEKYIPIIILFKGNIYIVGKSIQKCKDIESILKANMMMSTYGGEKYTLSSSENMSLKNLESEKYRINIT